jgi:hypothetical protein
VLIFFRILADSNLAVAVLLETLLCSVASIYSDSLAVAAAVLSYFILRNVCMSSTEVSYVE